MWCNWNFQSYLIAYLKARLFHTQTLQQLTMDFYLNFLVGTLSTCTATCCVSLSFRIASLRTENALILKDLAWYSLDDVRELVVWEFSILTQLPRRVCLDSTHGYDQGQNLTQIWDGWLNLSIQRSQGNLRLRWCQGILQRVSLRMKTLLLSLTNFS